MSTEYDKLDLDGILELSRSDAEHAGDMAEQARVLREMSGGLQDKVDLMRGVMSTLFGDDDNPDTGSWAGESSKMMKTEIDRLFTAAKQAPDVLENNAKAMDDFSSKVHSTLVSIDQLHVSSKGHGSDVAAEGSDTEKAREIMQEASTGYLSSAQEMPEPEFYNGLRESSQDSPSGDWTADHGATPAPVPGSQPVPDTPVHNPDGPVHTTPSPGQPVTGTGPALQSPGPVMSPGPVATPGPAPVPAPTPLAPLPLGPGGFPGPRPVPPPMGIPGPRPAPPMGIPAPRPPGTVPPVIGPRRPPAMPTPAPRPPVPRPTGTVPSVIGSRPGAPVAPVSHRPVAPGPNAPVRPVIGSRPGFTAVPARPVAPNPNGTVRPVIGSRPGMVPMASRSTMPATGRGTAPGIAQRGGPAQTPAQSRGLAAAPRGGSSSLVPASYRNARPAGTLAFGSRPTAAKTPAITPRKTEAPQQFKPPPGQRIRPMPRQGGPVVERAIVRGFQKPKTRGPGQEVFAAFDAAKDKDSRKADAAAAGDPDEVWEIRRVTVPAVISTREGN